MSIYSNCTGFWILVLIFLATLIYLYLIRNHKYWKKRKIPYEKPSLIFGCVGKPFIGKENIGDTYQNLYWKFDGQPYFGIFKFMQPALFLRDTEIIKKVLTKDFSSFQNNDFQLDIEVDPYIGKNIFVLRDNIWKSLRSKITTVLTANKIKLMVPSMLNVVDDMLAYLQNEVSQNPGDGIDLKDISARYTIDNVTINILGVKGDCFKNNSKFRTIAYKIFGETSFLKHLKFILIIMAPSLHKILKARLVTEEMAGFFKELVGDVIKQRKESGVTRNDMIQHLLALKEASDEDQKTRTVNPKNWWEVFTFQDIVASAVSFFFEGYETSATTLSFLLFELSLNPKIQQRLREEACNAIKENGGTLTYDVVNRLPYLEMVFQETLRKNPPVLYMAKLCTKPYDLPKPDGSTLRIEKDVPVIIPTYSLQHDPRYFPDPETFDPERFNEENIHSINKFAFYPFGEGPRMCVGINLAKTQVKICIVSILLNYEIQTCKKTVYPFVKDPHSFLLSAKDGVWANFVKINS